MRKLLLFILILVLSSCSLLHFFPPSANNVLTQPNWTSMISLNDITNSKNYSITVTREKRIYIAFHSPSYSKFALVSTSYKDSEWETNYQGVVSWMDQLKTVYNDTWGVTFATQSGGMAQLKKQDSTGGWSDYGIPFAAAANPQWDYCFGDTSIAYVLALETPTSFKLATNNNPTSAGSWDTVHSFNKDVGYNIMDYSADVDSHGNVFVGTADINNCNLYYNGTGGGCSNFFTSDGQEYAKVVVDGNDQLYLIYRSKDFQIKARILNYQYPDLFDNGSILIYGQGFYIDGLNHPNGISVAADKNSSKIYIGVISMENRIPVVIKLENGIISPMPAFPDYLTNCTSIKLAVTVDGLPAAAVLLKPTLHVFRTWN